MSEQTEVADAVKQRKRRSVARFAGLLVVAIALFAGGDSWLIAQNNSCGDLKVPAATLLVGDALLFALMTEGLRRLLVDLGRSPAAAKRAGIAVGVLLAFPAALYAWIGVLCFAFGPDGCP